MKIENEGELKNRNEQIVQNKTAPKYRGCSWFFCKVMDINPTKHMVFFLCIDYTIWPGGQQIIEDCQKKKEEKNSLVGGGVTNNWRLPAEYLKTTIDNINSIQVLLTIAAWRTKNILLQPSQN